MSYQVKITSFDVRAIRAVSAKRVTSGGGREDRVSVDEQLRALSWWTVTLGKPK